MVSERTRLKGICKRCKKNPLPPLKKRCEECRDEVLVGRNARAKSPEYRAVAKVYATKWKAENPQEYKDSYRATKHRLRFAVIFHYGGECKCCGEDGLPFLAMDHINGDGAAHRRELMRASGTTSAKSGEGFYRWLRDNNFPEGYQVLCHSCNLAKGTGKLCPHQISRLPHKDQLDLFDWKVGHD